MSFTYRQAWEWHQAYISRKHLGYQDIQEVLPAVCKLHTDPDLAIARDAERRRLDKLSGGGWYWRKREWVNTNGQPLPLYEVFI